MKEVDFNSNEIIKRLPNHLRKWVVAQPYEQYTAQNQAVWRYVMRKSVDYLSQFAHPSYLDGLAKAGISMEEIPHMQGMNRILKDLGWAAVAVKGFIPPNAFMEFQSYNVLVIASDIRTIDHISYTPAPDIIHEAAGHAPIIANPAYAEYLRRFGELGSRAIGSAEDKDRFEAIRNLSILKENPSSSQREIRNAEERVHACNAAIKTPSEMSRLRNLHWWTVEYGLIGSVEQYKIFGAGLLSSIGESQWCMSDQVEKIPYSIAAADVGFDITKPQKQLFVTPNFPYLSVVLEEFANEMALRKGGIFGLKKLISSRGLGTIKLHSGIQISGLFSTVFEDKDGNPIYFQTQGPSSISFRNKELLGHGTVNHPDGFGSPVGLLKGIKLPIEEMSPTDLEHYGIIEGETVCLTFESKVQVAGEIITGKRNLQGKIILISFKNCTVKLGDQYLFAPEWGTYDMAVGKEIVSAYAGVADPMQFVTENSIPQKSPKINYSKQDKILFGYYQKVRDIRLKGTLELSELKGVFDLLCSSHPNDWLLPLEIYELIPALEVDFKTTVMNHLNELSKRKEYSHLIKDGLALL